MKNILLVILLLVFFSLSCSKPTEPQPNKASLTLKLEDVSCTEAWIKLSANNLPLPSTVVIKQNDLTRATINLNTNDTLLYVDSLLPKQTYKFKPVLQTTNTPKPISNELSITTMDTTSHNFTWQSWTFGTTGNSTLYDVAIIDENNIWAVGEIRIADTSINGYTTYNAVHWNGSEWKLKRIFLPTVCGSTSVTSYPAKAIFAFDDGQIWISSSGDKIARLQNGVQIDKFCLPTNVSMSINKLWGSSSNDLYAVGNGGNIAHWDGVRWRRLESGTSLGLSDIFGTTNNQIYVCGLHYGQSKGIVLRKKGQIWETLIEGDVIDSTQLFRPKLFGITKGLWIDEKNTLYVVGNLLYRYHLGKWSLDKSLAGNNFTGNPNYIYRGALHAICGNKSNDLFIVGEINTVRHFNGVTWAQIGLPYHPLKYDMFWYQCDVKNNMMVAVGKFGWRASIIMAKR